MDNSYDLTTQDGYNKAEKVLKTLGWLLFPGPMVIGNLLKKVFSPEITTEKQVEAAKGLIKAGKENGVKKLKLKVSHEAGIDVGSNIEGIPVHAKLGNNGMMELEVEY